VSGTDPDAEELYQLALAATRSDPRAVPELMDRAAEAGHPEAMLAAALLRLRQVLPRGVRSSDTEVCLSVADVLLAGGHDEAEAWVRRAADGGCAKALVVQARLAEARHDLETATSLLERAAALGDTGAMSYLGSLAYLRGDRDAARLWYGRAADGGAHAGLYGLAGLLEAEDPEAARALLERAATAGNLLAMNELAVRGAEEGGKLDPERPPQKDPRSTGIFRPDRPVSRRRRGLEDCPRCHSTTVQDYYEVGVSRLGALDLAPQGNAGKLARRALFRSCTICGCLFPVDQRAEAFVRRAGGELFDPRRPRGAVSG
jgi:TPR repeat protein